MKHQRYKLYLCKDFKCERLQLSLSLRQMVII